MATKTIDLLLDLETKKEPSIDQLKIDLADLEKKAEKGKKAIKGLLLIDGEGSASVKKARQSLAAIEKDIEKIHAEAQKRTLEKSLKQAGEQANRTRERMEKLVQVGSRLAMAGAAIVAPFALSVNKYLEAQKKLEEGGGKMDENARRMVALQERWAASQERIGKVATEILLPYLEKALDLVDKIAAFSEAHPNAVKAALGIGGAMVAIGGALSVFGSIVGTLATVQGLLAGAGIAGGGAAAAGGTAAITAAISGAVPAILAGITAILASPLTWAIAALALTVPIMNWLLGTDQTWKDIGETGHKALILIGYGIDQIIKGIGAFFKDMGQKIWDGLVKLAKAVVEGVGGAIARLLSLIPGKATGGYMPTGLYNVSEGGRREFALNNSTTQAAERMIGGKLTQENLIASLAGGRRVTYHDNRHIDSRLSATDRRIIRDDIINGLAGAF